MWKLDSQRLVQNGRGRRGFTLIELLLVVTLICVMLAMLLPLVSRAREYTRETICKSNLHQLLTGWQMFIQGNHGMIPYTSRLYKKPNWQDGMRKMYPDMPYVYGNNILSYSVCPTLQERYRPMYYTTNWLGYAVNSAWQSTPLVSNELKMWGGIRNPSTYPWLMDPEVYDWADSKMAVAYTPWITTGPPNWGVGFHHRQSTSANVGYADLSVSGVNVSLLAFTTPSNFPWFDNR